MWKQAKRGLLLCEACDPTHLRRTFPQLIWCSPWDRQMSVLTASAPSSFDLDVIKQPVWLTGSMQVVGKRVKGNLPSHKHWKKCVSQGLCCFTQVITDISTNRTLATHQRWVVVWGRGFLTLTPFQFRCITLDCASVTAQWFLHSSAFGGIFMSQK